MPRMKLVFATGNQHKVDEVQRIIGSLARDMGGLEIVSLSRFDIDTDLPETTDTLEGNALQKARFVADTLGVSCFAEDTGLEIEALQGRPGVWSARYAGSACTAQDNIRLVLSQMAGQENRTARFRTVVALIVAGLEWLFEGRCEGQITLAPRGQGGFGYDPIFQPDGYPLTFAELSMSTKNTISHRRRAFDGMWQKLSR